MSTEVKTFDSLRARAKHLITENYGIQCRLKEQWIDGAISTEDYKAKHWEAMNRTRAIQSVFR